MKAVLLVLSLSAAVLLLLAGCGPARSRQVYDPGHKHAEEVGELTLPNGE